MRYVRSGLIVWLVVACLGAAWAAPTEGRISVPVASVYSEPNPQSERVTQALLWDRVQVLETRGKWYKVLVTEQYRTPQGYPGWVMTDQVALRTPPTLPDFLTVQVAKTALRVAPEATAKPALWAYLGTRLPLAPTPEGKTAPEGWQSVNLPGQKAVVWVRSADLGQENVEAVTDTSSLVACAEQLKGTVYLWGGMSAQGVDCSGLTYTVYRRYGWEIPRDADQQFEIGTAVPNDQLQPGDLLFFGKSPTDITHVGIYKGDGKFVHASSKSGKVTVSKLDEPAYAERYQGARRIVGPATHLHP